MRKPRILVLRGGAIGDFVMTLPAVSALRRRWPESHIEIVGYPHIARLAEAGGLADAVVSLDKAEMARFFSWAPRITRDQEDYIRSFDLLISYLYDPEGTVKENLLAVGAKQVICGSPMVKDLHAAAQLLKPLEALAIYPESEEEVRPRLALKPEHREAGQARVRELGGDVVAVHPGSGSPKKNWPAERFIALAGRIRRRKPLKPVFIIGEADREAEQAIGRAGGETPVLSGLSLVELAGILSACRAYVGNDSGVTHIAAALGIPVVALFGPTNLALWGPRGGAVRVIRAAEPTPESLAAIPEDDVMETLTRLLPKQAGNQ